MVLIIPWINVEWLNAHVAEQDPAKKIVWKELFLKSIGMETQFWADSLTHKL